ncbi:MAG: reductive dehalogenase domain-containing protein [Chloroflexota bacterium]|nr:reductive dehalogenase domain-containing protein [Chloroflexota bacterium]
MPIPVLLSILTGLGLACAMVLFAIVSWSEAEPRAAGRALLLAFLLPLPYLAVLLVPSPVQNIIAWLLVGLTLGAGLFFLLPIGNDLAKPQDTPRKRFDERDIMFSRRLLQPGSERFKRYYAEHPDRLAPDDKFRRRPGLLAPGALYYDPITAAAAEASFAAVAAFHPILENDAAQEQQIAIDPEQMSVLVKWWARKLGAMSVGITLLRDYHLYSHIGRGRGYGEPVTLDHPFAIALTVEMDKEMVDRAPFGPIVMESTHQYLESGAIAVQLAEFIKKLGYSARAHIDGNYRVICPLVARDAGLGEIGRMGLLMTPELGPRVRLAVVTTDVALQTGDGPRDLTMLDFCARCNKCADACPSRSIPFGEASEIDGALRWQIDSQSCFTYWCTIGTDCGRCMSVCPYSHPDNLAHNLVRWGIKRSGPFRSTALMLDDFFYGRTPEPAPVQPWLIVESDKTPEV